MSANQPPLQTVNAETDPNAGSGSRPSEPTRRKSVRDRIRDISGAGWAFVATQVLIILPVWVAAWRDGHQGWFPTLDAANTVLRSRDVLGSHTPLVGMWSSVSIKLGSPTYFPGATELYLLSVPIKFLGNSWGTLIGMALLNSFWLLVGGWLLRRRLGTVGAIWGSLALMAFVWTMGSEALVDVAPMQMITIPFAVFLIAVWSVADRDLGAIPVLALLANFLVLNHLVLTFLVPIIGICAPIGLVLSLRSLRKRERQRWPDQRRYLIRQLLVSAAIAVALWFPSIIQQFSYQPGNLTNLWRASQTDLQRTVSLEKAVSVVFSVIAEPPFWFRDSFSSPSSTSLHGPMLISLVILVGLGVAALLYVSFKRRDRLATSALVVAVVAVAAAIYNVLAAPTDFGFRTGYFRSLWCTAMFFWLAVAVAIVRWIADRYKPIVLPQRRLAAIGVVLVMVLSFAALPHADPGSGTNGTSDASVALVKKVMNRSIVMLRDKGQVRVFTSGDFTSYATASALILALDSYGVDVCVPPSLVAQYGAERACKKGGPDTNAMVSAAAFPPWPGEQVIAQATLLTPAESREKARLAGEVAKWLATQTEILPADRVRNRLVNAYGDDATEKLLADTFNTNGLALNTLVFSPTFVAFIDHRSIWRPDGTADAAIKTGSLPPEDLVRWANLTQREYTGESVRISIIEHVPESVFKTPSNSDPYGNLPADHR